MVYINFESCNVTNLYSVLTVVGVFRLYITSYHMQIQMLSHLPFQFRCFTSLSCFIALRRIPSTTLNRSDESRHLFLVPDLSKILSNIHY